MFHVKRGKKLWISGFVSRGTTPVLVGIRFPWFHVERFDKRYRGTCFTWNEGDAMYS